MTNLTIHKGNCFDSFKHVADGSVDLILCDLPYGITRNKWDKALNLKDLWEQYNRVLKRNGAALLFGTGKFLMELGASNLEDYRYDITWLKTAPVGFLNASRAPMRIHESILVFYREEPTFNRVYIENAGKPYRTARGSTGKCYGTTKNDAAHAAESVNGERLTTDVLVYAKDRKNKAAGKANSTSKPVKLLEHLIKMYTNEGMTVLDNCMGSGSTGVACVNLKRNFIGMELDPEMYEAAATRLKSTGVEVVEFEQEQVELG